MGVLFQIQDENKQFFEFSTTFELYTISEVSEISTSFNIVSKDSLFSFFYKS